MGGPIYVEWFKLENNFWITQLAPDQDIIDWQTLNAPDAKRIYDQLATVGGAANPFAVEFSILNEHWLVVADQASGRLNVYPSQAPR